MAKVIYEFDYYEDSELIDMVNQVCEMYKALAEINKIANNVADENTPIWLESIIEISGQYLR